VRWIVLVAMSAVAWPQTPPRLTLAEAEAIALRNHPGIEASNLDALALGERIHQARSARQPFVTANATATGAPEDTRLAAGALNNPAIFSRFATGISINQTLLDFGRTSRLIQSARSSAAAGEARSATTRADVTLSVRRAYYDALRAGALLRVAKATVDTRQTVVDQVTELVKAQVKSSLDKSFAETSLAEAKLLVSSVENERQASYANLAQALGRQVYEVVELAEEPLPAVEPLALSELRAEALQKRPELKAARLETDAARQYAAAEHALRNPSIAATVGAGLIPKGAAQLQNQYVAGGLNISLPFLNGGLFKARQAEAELHARAVDRRAMELETRVARDVATAWLNANTAWERIHLTRQLLEQAGQALELAQTRYELGLSSIVELSQAQLAKTNAEIQVVTAQYDYQWRRSVLNYQTGNL
jgi:outer membrane protein